MPRLTAAERATIRDQYRQGTIPSVYRLLDDLDAADAEILELESIPRCVKCEQCSGTGDVPMIYADGSSAGTMECRQCGGEGWSMKFPDTKQGDT